MKKQLKQKGNATHKVWLWKMDVNGTRWHRVEHFKKSFCLSLCASEGFTRHIPCYADLLARCCLHTLYSNILPVHFIHKCIICLCSADVPKFSFPLHTMWMHAFAIFNVCTNTKRIRFNAFVNPFLFMLHPSASWCHFMLSCCCYSCCCCCCFPVSSSSLSIIQPCKYKSSISSPT